jgi:hypothetical protein
MGPVRVPGVPYSCSVAWRTYSVGRTRALRCIAHVHVLVALDAAAPPLRNHGVGASWTLLGGCSRMLLVAWCGMLLHGIGALRTNGISRRVRSPGPIRSAKGTWRCSPPHCVNATGKASPAVDISFKAKQHSCPKHNHRPLRCADSNATCSSGRVQDASPDFLLNQYLHPSGPPSAWLCARRACVRA